MASQTDLPALAARARRLTQQHRRGGDRFVLSDAIEHRCQTVDISSSGAALRAAMRGDLGEQVICYLDHYGRFEGRVVRLLDDGFAVAFNASTARRDKLARQFAWPADDIGPAGMAEPYRGRRVTPEQAGAVLRLADGKRLAVQIVELTRHRVTFTASATLTAGAAVVIGHRPAVVARVMQRLATATFDTAIADAEFTPDIVL